MLKKIMLVIFVVLPLLLPGPNLWADDDAIMDVDDNAAVFTGTWPRSTYRILYYGDDYQYATGAGYGRPATATATFTTAQVADTTGYYQVYVRWTAGTARATNARYRIYDGSTYRGDCTFDQRYNGGTWQFCREVQLTVGRRGVVRLDNYGISSSQYVCADAVRFVRQSWEARNLAAVDLRKAGVDWSSSSSRGINMIALPPGPYSDLASASITAPSGGTGYVVVSASGFVVLTTAQHHVNICIDDASGGTSCDTNIRSMAINTDEVNSGAPENRKAFHIQEVYSISGGTTKTYYLKAFKGSAATTGVIYWDDFVALYVPRFY